MVESDTARVSDLPMVESDTARVSVLTVAGCKFPAVVLGKVALDVVSLGVDSFWMAPWDVGGTLGDSCRLCVTFWRTSVGDSAVLPTSDSEWTCFEVDQETWPVICAQYR